METYVKPTIFSGDTTRGIIPLAALGPVVALGGPVATAIGSVVGAAAAVGAAKSVVMGGAALIGATAALRKGSNFIDSSRTQILTARKNFSLA